jgi:hypothetical protein
MRFVVSHPFREERGKDGATGFVVSHPSHKNKGVARVGRPGGVTGLTGSLVPIPVL